MLFHYFCCIRDRKERFKGEGMSRRRAQSNSSNHSTDEEQGYMSRRSSIDEGIIHSYSTTPSNSTSSASSTSTSIPRQRTVRSSFIWPGTTSTARSFLISRKIRVGLVLRTPRRLGDFEPAGLLASLLHDGGRATRWASALAEKAAPNAGFRGTPAQHLVHQ